MGIAFDVIGFPVAYDSLKQAGIIQAANALADGKTFTEAIKKVDEAPAQKNIIAYTLREKAKYRLLGRKVNLFGIMVG